MKGMTKGVEVKLLYPFRYKRGRSEGVDIVINHLLITVANLFAIISAPNSFACSPSRVTQPDRTEKNAINKLNKIGQDGAGRKR